MALIVEEDVFCHPNDVGVAGAGGIMFEVDDIPILFEEFFLFLGCGRNWLCHLVAFFEVVGL